VVETGIVSMWIGFGGMEWAMGSNWFSGKIEAVVESFVRTPKMEMYSGMLLRYNDFSDLQLSHWLSIQLR